MTDQQIRLQSQNDHIRFLESLDLVNQAIQGATDLEQMIQRVLKVVLEIFDSDRAVLVYPCDPSQPVCELIREQAKPEWAIKHFLGDEFANDEAGATEEAEISQVLHLVRNSDVPVAFGQGAEHPLPAMLTRRFAIQSQLAVAVYPKCDLPYMFGLRQCSHPRVWTAHERRLLQEVGRRLADGLGSQIVYRQLRDSESRFRVLVDHATDAFFLHSTDGTILDANRQASEALGYSVEELIGMKPSEFDVGISQEEWARFECELNDNKVVTFESRHRRKNGEIIPVEVSVRPLWQGGERFAVSLSRDITSRKRAEQALRVSERRLDAAQQMAHVAWWQEDFESGIASRSLEAYAIFGLPGGQGEELLDWDQRWRQRIHPEDLERTCKAYSIALEGGPRYDLEYRIVRPTGEVRYVHSQADVTFDGCGRLLRIFGTMQDITELRQTERELRASEARFRTLVDHAADAFFLMDDSGTVLDVNRQAYESLGYSYEELIGKRPMDFDPTVSQLAIEAMRTRLDAGEIISFETQHKRKDGTVFPVDIRIRPFWESGKRFAVALVRDITDRMRLEEQFRQAQKMEAVGQLAGGIAHDFNNLLTVINSYSEILSNDLPTGDPKRELAAEVLKAGERAANLTRQLLAFSRKQILQPQIVSFNSILGDLARLLRRLIGEDIELVFDAEPTLGAAQVDPGQFEQAIINLALNARDAMPEGGKISLTTKNIELDDLDDPNIPPGRYVLVAMSDTGQGMDEATKSRIFEPFFTTKDQGKGTGLGLAMVYGFVKQSNGYIEVSSEVGRGTTMRVYLPRVDTSAPTHPPAEPPKFVMPVGTETVLLVEDEEAVRVLSRNILKSCGYKVLEAQDGLEGLAIAQQAGAIDLLVTDLIMPRMGGKQLADAVLESRPCIRLLFLSGYAEGAVTNRSIRCDSMPFLQKPFSAMNFARKVREVLDTDTR